MSNDYPFNACLKEAVERHAQGWDFYQKFTCQRCKRRLTVATPNKFFHKGTCDHCGAVTDIAKRGCNYMVVSSRGALAEAGRFNLGGSGDGQKGR